MTVGVAIAMSASAIVKAAYEDKRFEQKRGSDRVGEAENGECEKEEIGAVGHFGVPPEVGSRGRGFSETFRG